MDDSSIMMVLDVEKYCLAPLVPVIRYSCFVLTRWRIRDLTVAQNLQSINQKSFATGHVNILNIFAHG